ncbi:MAG TPA: ABC transporter substrate-binding protein [Pseudolabrys sp.]|nr:ABC transporter substrate-binding protein [Pseudolabrys sp.]
MKRRNFIAGLLGTATAADLGTARAQQTPVIGFLRNASAASSARLMAGFRQGLSDTGLVEGRGVAIEYRWAEHSEQQLPEMATDLVHRGVALIATGGGIDAALAAKRATAAIPIVFEAGGDPVKMGLVASLNRPGGNVTGVALFSNTIGPKRVELIKGIMPTSAPIGVLANPDNANTRNELPLLQHAAASSGIALITLDAAAPAQLDDAFRKAADGHVGGLLVIANPFFVAHREEIVAAAARHRLPAIYPFRDFAQAGGLMSYGDNLVDAFRQLGVYSGRILHGEKPADLPVIRPSKFELVINLKTAKALGVAMPGTLLALADEVIE